MTDALKLYMHINGSSFMAKLKERDIYLNLYRIPELVKLLRETSAARPNMPLSPPWT